jgi:hypothetical protein
LLLRNPSIVVPGLGAGAVAALAGTLLEPARPLDSNLVSRLLQSLVQLVASILSVAYTTGMADAAWREGSAGFADGARAFRRNASHVLGAMLVLFAIGAIAALLAPFTLGLSLLAYLFFCIYTMAAAVAGERSGIVAVRESVDIAFTRAVPTLIVSLGIALVCFVTGALAELVATTPFVGALAGGIVVQAAIAYAMIVVVGEYRALRGFGGVPPI